MKSKAFSIRVGPWLKGIVDNVPAETLPFVNSESSMAALVDAVNVDITRTGEVHRRPAWDEVAPTPSHSLLERDGRSWAVVDNDLVELTDTGTRSVMPSSGPVYWATHEGALLFSCTSGVYALDLAANTCTQLSGTGAPDESDRVFANLPGGTHLHSWNGRLVMARGRSIYFSEPLNYGVYDTLTGRLDVGGRITWMAALTGGIYVGVNKKVLFLAGTDPDKLQRTTVSEAAWDSAAVKIPANDLGQPGDMFVAWVEPTGFALGNPAGTVERPMKKDVDNWGVYAGRLSYQNNRIILVETPD